MGAGLAQRALLEPVDDDAKCVLVAMALAALDMPRNGQRAGIYFGGHEYLMQVAFGEIPKQKTAQYEQAERKIRRRINKLTKARSIERIQDATGRRHARYKLILAAGQPVDNSAANVLPLPDRRSPDDLLNGHETTSYSSNRRSRGDRIGGHETTSGSVQRRKKEEE